MKNVVLLVVIVLLLGGAAWFMFRGSPDSEIPDDPSETTHWMCEKCGWSADLTDRKLEEWRLTPELRCPDPRLGKQMVFRCPECKTYTVVTGLKCRPHDRWYCAISSKGLLLGCPECAKEAPR